MESPHTNILLLSAKSAIYRVFGIMKFTAQDTRQMEELEMNSKEIIK